MTAPAAPPPPAPAPPRAPSAVPARLHAASRGRVARWHRWLGLALTVPLLGWIASSAAMMLTTLDAPNGLAGSYTLTAHNSVDVPLDGARIAPEAILRRVRAEHGLERVHALRLESRGAWLWYVVKPTPYALAMTFDAHTGARLDPLPDSLLAVVAGEALRGSRVARVEDAPEYNRYYAVDRVPAVRAHVVGEQPATLVLSRDEGRTLRRLNAATRRFEWWYRTFHVNQFTDDLGLWTALLYACAAGMVVLVVLGYRLVWSRRRPVALPRPAAGATAPPSRPGARTLHRHLGAAVGGLVLVQLAVGVYLWLCLGPLEDAFRGKASFNPAWRGGLPTDARLADAAAVLARTRGELDGGARPVQAIEWRRLGGRDAWLVSPRRDEPPRVFESATARPIAALPPAVAGAIAREEMIGRAPGFYVASAPQLWMDLNRPVPTYRFRFADPWTTDVYVAQATGEVIQRRPFFWRLFDPLLAVHMFQLTGVAALDVALLALFQAVVLTVLVTGWRLELPRLRRGWRERAAALRSAPRPRVSDPSPLTPVER